MIIHLTIKSSFLLIAMCSALACDSAIDNIAGPMSTPLEPISQPTLIDPPNIVKAEIIKLTLSNLSKKDHRVSNDGNIYLQVSEHLFKLLPKQINGIPLQLHEDIETADQKHIDVVTFRSWDESDLGVTVTNTTYFWGGNIGGCNYVFRKEQDRLSEKSRSCFAGAS